MRIQALAFTAVLAAACGVEDVSDPVAGDAAAPADDAIVYPDVEPEPLFSLQFIDPDHGSFTGGTEVTVRGNGFVEGMTVLFGDRMVEPLDIELVDSRRLVILTPPGDPGAADVEIIAGNLTAELEELFTYEAVDIAPDFGAVAGGTFVTVSGFGTDFSDTTLVTLDGLPLTNVEIVSETQLTGFTPPGIAGAANLTAVTDTGVFDARRSFTYNTTVDPFNGGMGGGPIMGTVNVTVVDSRSRNGVDHALVAIGDPNDTDFIGRADDLGQITFSAPDLVGPITVTAAADEYETQQFVSYDARDITIFLVRQIPPEPGGALPPGRQPARIFGHIVFGGPTGLGTPEWNLVPEPRTSTEVKRIYVTTTAPSPFSSPYAPTAPIDFDAAEGKNAWEFDTWARPSALAVVAIAGLYDSDKDPSGLGVTGFEPFAMGVTRGVLVGPGEDKVGVDVVIDIPLDATLHVDLIDPPRLNSRDWSGPTHYQIRPFLDFGGEGVIAMNKNGLPIPPAPEERPNRYTFAEDETSITLGGMAPLAGKIVDASYGMIVGAYADSGFNPYSVRSERGIKEIEYPVTMGDFIGMPRPVDPLPESLASRLGITIEHEGPSTGEVTFDVHLLSAAGGPPLYRVFARGDELDLDLPDMARFGLMPTPRNKDVAWTFYSLRIVGGASFDDFNYRMLSINSWSAYAVDAYFVQFPPDAPSP
jgi:hypothetical protein